MKKTITFVQPVQHFMASINFNGIDKGTMKVILDEQTRLKKLTGRNQVSLSFTLIKIIQQFNNKCRETA